MHKNVRLFSYWCFRPAFIITVLRLVQKCQSNDELIALTTPSITVEVFVSRLSNQHFTQQRKKYRDHTWNQGWQNFDNNLL